MANYIIISILSFLIGFIIAYLFCKNKNYDNKLFILINDFRKTIDSYKNQTEINSKEINNAIQVAQNLSKALTTNQNLKGQFGEDCLENIIKSCYPEENINYIKQFKTLNDENKEIKPDFVVNLPNNKSIIIDCKLNIEKYIEYKENNDENLEIIKKNEFIKDLNSTINSLSNKHYEKAQNLNQTDFILMYIPIETVLTLIYTDKDFLGVIKNANEKNIIIVGNSSILTTIKLVKLLWAQDSQEKNIEKIVSIAENIYEYIALHTQNLHKIKETLENNIQDFEKEYDKMTKDNKLFKSIEELRQYGIQTKNQKIGKKLNEITINDNFLS